MNTDSSNNERKDYEIPCQLHPVVEFDMCEGMPPEELAKIPVGGFMRDEILHEPVEFDFDSLTVKKNIARHVTLESFYEKCEYRLGIGTRGAGLLERPELWALIWFTIFELGKLTAKKFVKWFMDEALGRDELTSVEVYEILDEIKRNGSANRVQLQSLNAKFNRHERLLAELRDILQATDRRSCENRGSEPRATGLGPEQGGKVDQRHPG